MISWLKSPANYWPTMDISYPAKSSDWSYKPTLAIGHQVTTLWLIIALQSGLVL